MSLYLGENKIADNTCSRNIGEIIQSTIPLTDAGLHLLDGALISSAGSYAKFVNYIAGLVSNYPDLFTTEANWQSSVTTYGVCGKFVYDSVNNTVRLPKITGFTEGTTDVTALGDLVEAGLPNITGKGASLYGYSSPMWTGAFSGTTSGISNVAIGGSGGSLIDFNASNSNSIYGNSTTVQPQSIKVLYYIVIATMVKTDIQVDIDEIATDLNGKADVDLSNVNSSGTSLASGWSMPSSRYIDLTLGASGTQYVAPANGYIILAGELSANTWLNIRDDDTMTNIYQTQQLTTAYSMGYMFAIKKGGKFSVNWGSGNWTGRDWQKFRFVYAQGEQ